MDAFYFLVGSMNRQGPWFQASGKGLSLLSLQLTSGTFRHIADYPAIENTIWLKRAPFGFIAASEQYLQNGRICSFAIDPDLAAAIRRPVRESNGGAICHIETVEAHRTVIVTSFLGGVSLHSYDAQGNISAACQVIDYPGKGIKPLQDRSHPHQATLTPDGKKVLVCDLGTDTVWDHTIRVHKDGRAYLDKGVPLAAKAGSGPRHLVFHPVLPVFYLLGQLDGAVAVYDYRFERSRFRNSMPVLFPSFSGELSAAAIKIHPSGKALYISERQHNSILVFEIGETGDLVRNGSFSCGGLAPRDFLFSNTRDWLIVLNHDSDSIVSFRTDPFSGLPDPRPAAVFSTGCPVCGLSLNNEPSSGWG